MSAAINILAFEALGKHIEESIPELAGHVCPYPTDPNHKLDGPSLGIEPTTFKYFPDQAEEVLALSYDTVIERVGHHEVDLRLVLLAGTSRVRTALAEKVTNLFAQRELAPGVILLEIPEAYDEVVSFELIGSEWEPERVFDKKWYCTLDVKAQIPALVQRGGVYTIEELRMAIYEDPSEDLDTVVDFDSEEVVSILEDGDLEPV